MRKSLTALLRFYIGTFLRTITEKKEFKKLANHKSALKRAQQNEIRRIRNKAVKTRVKNIAKNVRLAVEEKNLETSAAQLNVAKAAIDKAKKKGVLHRKTASRKISRLTRLVNKLSA
jgi:small subunit ribosomal protein S20